METSSQRQLALLRKKLEQRLGELQTDLRVKELTSPSETAPGFEEVRDTKDDAASSSSTEVLAAQAERDLDELGMVEAALRRLTAGNYGECLDCGEQIPFARLAIQPAAPRCARCQAKAEEPRLSP